MRRASSRCGPNETSIGRRAGAAGDGALQRLGELAAGLLLAVGHEVRDRRRARRGPRSANMRMKAALAVTMRPSASAVAMPNGADWNTRVKRTSAWARAAARVSSSLRSSTSTEMTPCGPWPRQIELGGKGAAVLAQQIELEPRRAARRVRPTARISAAPSAGHDVEQRQRACPTPGAGRSHCDSVALIWARRPSGATANRPCGRLS